MARMCETGLLSNFGNREGPLFEERRRPLHAPLNHVLMHRNSSRLPECRLQVGNTHVNSLGDIIQPKIPVEVIFDENNRLSESPAGHSLSRRERKGRE
jgi:hypothetical protein